MRQRDAVAEDDVLDRIAADARAEEVGARRRYVVARQVRDGSVVADVEDATVTNAIEFGTDNRGVETDAGVTGIDPYNVANGIGVKIYDSGSGQSPAPTIEGGTFVRCETGVEVTHEWVRSEAVIKN